MKLLEHQIAVVTGAGSGIGKAIAELFAAHGAHVVLVDTKYANIEIVAQEIAKKRGSAKCFAADVAKEKGVNDLFAFIRQNYGALHIMVNNAGVMDDFSAIDAVGHRQWKRVMATNLDGAFYCCRHAVKMFLKQGSGNIINISSIAGLNGGRAGLAYTVSKHGLIGLTKNTAYAYALKGIRCNAIAPGAIQTNIMHEVQPNPFGLDRMEAGATNMPPAGSPQQIAKVALFLANEQSSYMNGAVLIADGGWTAY